MPDESGAWPDVAGLPSGIAWTEEEWLAHLRARLGVIDRLCAPGRRNTLESPVLWLVPPGRARDARAG